MKNKLKSYLVFTSLMYRVLVYFIVPIFMAGIVFVYGGALGGAVPIVISVLLSAAEIVCDNWLFGGIQAKDAERLDYLKTSERGNKIMRNALRMDIVRKLLTALIVLGICFVVPIWSKGGKGYIALQASGTTEALLSTYSYAVAISWCCSIFGIFIARYGSMVWTNAMVGYGVAMLETGLWSISGRMKNLWGYSLFYILVGVAFSVLCVKAAMKRMEDGYCDK